MANHAGAHALLEGEVGQDAHRLLEVEEGHRCLTFGRERDRRAHFERHGARQFGQAGAEAIDDAAQPVEALLDTGLGIAGKGPASGGGSTVDISP